MNKQLAEITPLILAGDGYQLTIAPEAEVRKLALLDLSRSVTTVTTNDESGDAQYHVRNLAAMRIEGEKSRKLVKEPINRIGKLIDAATSDFLAEIIAEENRIKKLVGDHAEDMLRIQAEKEAAERKAFEAARAAREAAEGGSIAAVLAAKKAAAEKLQASDEVAAAKIADGVRFAWDFEVMDIDSVYRSHPELVTIEIKRSAVLAWFRQIEDEDGDPRAAACLANIRAFKKPIVSSR